MKDQGLNLVPSTTRQPFGESMKTLAITNIRGGATKTTQTAHLAIAAAKAGRRVLMVDLDPQAQLTDSFTREMDPTYYIHNLILDYYRFGSIKTASVKSAILKTSVHNLSIIPSHMDLNAVPGTIGHNSNLKGLAQILEAVEEDYDYVILDTPATFGYFHSLAFVASDAYVVALAPDTFSLKGLWDSQVAVDSLKARLKRENPVFFGWIMARVPLSEIQAKGHKQGLMPPPARHVALRAIRSDMDGDWNSRIAEIPQSSAFENARALMKSTMTIYDLPRTGYLQNLYKAAWTTIETRFKKGI